MANITPTRRSMLGAMALAPVVIAAPSVAAVSAPWDSLMAEFESAMAIADALPDDHVDMNEAYDRAFVIERRLLAMRAPHLHGVAWKLERLREQAIGFEVAPEQVDRILGDLRRLHS